MSAFNRSDDHADEPVRQSTRLAAAGLLAAAGGLHLAALPSHLNVSGVVGAFFAVTAAAQLLGAVVLAARPSSRTILAVISGNVAVLTLWVLSRTTGLPTGGELGLREPFGLVDGAAAAAEFLVVLAGLATLGRHPRTTGHPRRTGRWSRDWRMGLALGLTWVVSASAGLAVAHDGHDHGGGDHHGASSAGGYHHEERDLGQPSLPPATPALSRTAATGTCPAGHDCTDHSH